TAQNAKKDVLCADHRLTQGGGLLAGGLDRSARLAGDQHLSMAGGGRLLREVTVLVMRGLLGDAERARDLTPGRSGLKRAPDQVRRQLVELVSKRSEGA